MGAVFALFAGFYFWCSKIIGLTYNELLGKIHFWILFVGVNFSRNFIYLFYIVIVIVIVIVINHVLSKSKSI